MLTLQILINDHPIIKNLDGAEWPMNGFVHGLIEYYPNINIQNISNITNFKPSSLLQNFKSQLDQSRLIFEKVSEVKILMAQYHHSQSVIAMLKAMIAAVISVFGKPPCNLAICALGSTARHDRRPVF